MRCLDVSARYLQVRSEPVRGGWGLIQPTGGLTGTKGRRRGHWLLLVPHGRAGACPLLPPLDWDLHPHPRLWGPRIRLEDTLVFLGLQPADCGSPTFLASQVCEPIPENIPFPPAGCVSPESPLPQTGSGTSWGVESKDPAVGR